MTDLCFENTYHSSGDKGGDPKAREPIKRPLQNLDEEW